MNSSQSDRLKSKTIKKGLRVLHVLREGKGLSNKTVEMGFEVNLIEGRFKGKTPGVFLGGVTVAAYLSSEDKLEWTYEALAESVLRIDKATLDAKISELRPDAEL